MSTAVVPWNLNFIEASLLMYPLWLLILTSKMTEKTMNHLLQLFLISTASMCPMFYVKYCYYRMASILLWFIRYEGLELELAVF